MLSQYQNLEVQTGSVMMDQFKPQYLGVAYPYTMPAAVGGCDMPGQPKWRRPDQAQVEGRALDLRDPFFIQTEPARVKLYDVTRGLPRRIEAQYRRHWAFVPGLWNLYVREQVDIGVSLRCRSVGVKNQPLESVEQEAAMAAARLYEPGS